MGTEKARRASKESQFTISLFLMGGDQEEVSREKSEEEGRRAEKRREGSSSPAIPARKTADPMS